MENDVKCKGKEKIIALAKKRAKDHPRMPLCTMIGKGRGVYSYSYLGADWDPSISGVEFCFKSGSQYIYVDVITPVSMIHSMISEQVHSEIPLPDHLSLRSHTSTPNYKLLGKNKKRKRIVSYTMNFDDESLDSRGMSFKDWISLVEKREQEILETGLVTVQPSIDVQQYRYGKYVTIISEVDPAVTYDDLQDYALMVEQMMMGASVGDVLGTQIYDSEYYIRYMATYNKRKSDLHEIQSSKETH